MAKNLKLIQIVFVVNIMFVCVGLTSTRSSSVHQNKKTITIDKKPENEEVISVETEIPEVSEVGENNESNDALGSGRLNAKRRPNGCPYCDSSVYSYCSDKLLHDACCCLDPHDTDLPSECQFADCSFLHSNTCREHRLITACCCNQFLTHKK